MVVEFYAAGRGKQSDEPSAALATLRERTGLREFKQVVTALLSEAIL